MHRVLSSAFPLRLANIVFEIERAAVTLPEGGSMRRHVSRARDLLEDELGLRYTDPTGEPYAETRTDVDARIAGGNSDDLVITETLKPIIRQVDGGHQSIIQKGIVVVGPRQMRS